MAQNALDAARARAIFIDFLDGYHNFDEPNNHGCISIDPACLADEILAQYDITLREPEEPVVPFFGGDDEEGTLSQERIDYMDEQHRKGRLRLGLSAR